MGREMSSLLRRRCHGDISQWVAVCLAAFGLWGCASPNQLQTPISNFATAATSAATSFTAIDSQGAANLSSLHQAEALTVKRVNAPPDQCAVGDKACRLYYVKSPDTTHKPLYYASLMPKSVAFINGIKDYANALNALEKADATADVQSAYSDAMGAITAVAGALNVPAGVATSAISKPLGSVVGWAYGQYQNHLKNDALKAGIPAADKIIQQAVPILDLELQFAATAQAASLQSDFDAKDSAFLAQPTAANLKAEIQAANALDAALSGKPKAVIDDLAAAHAKLAAAAQNPTSSPADTIGAISTFLQQANNLKQIVASTSSANH